MVTCDGKEKVLSSKNVLLWSFQKIRYLIKRYAQLNRLLVGSGQITLNIELQKDDRTVCCSHTVVSLCMQKTLLVVSQKKGKENKGNKCTRKKCCHGSKIFNQNTLFHQRLIDMNNMHGASHPPTRTTTWYPPKNMYIYMTPDTWHVTPDMWHLTRDTWHMTHDTWHMTYDIWHVTIDMWQMVRGENCLKTPAPLL